jgi:hypothetical protein
LRRAFFFAWPLRRDIFCEWRESNFPMGSGAEPITVPRPKASALLLSKGQPLETSSSARSRSRTSRR